MCCKVLESKSYEQFVKRNEKLKAEIRQTLFAVFPKELLENIDFEICPNFFRDEDPHAVHFKYLKKPTVTLKYVIAKENYFYCERLRWSSKTQTVDEFLYLLNQHWELI